MYYDTAYYVLSVSDSYDLISDIDAAGVSSFRVNGLSDDGAYLASDAFINAPNGVLPFYGDDGWDFQPGFSSALSGNKNILETASLTDGLYNYLFFRRADGLGGYSTFNYSWVNVDVAGVLDLAVSDYNAYFATTGGAFALPPEFLSDPNLAVHKMPLPPEAPANIESLDFAPSGVFAGGTLFMGTANGAWEATVDESEGMSVGTASQIPGTASQKIQHIAVSPYDPATHQAFLSDYWLYIRKNSLVYEIPFFAVLPGKPTGMAWDSNYVLYISGTEGLSAVDVGS
jgi:hypothetical protein